MDYLLSIKEGRSKKPDVSIEEIGEIFSEAKQYDQGTLIGLVGAYDHESIIEYLSKKPGRILECINILEEDEAKQLFSRIDDERYKAELALNVNAKAEIISELFPYIEDDFIKNQIIISKVESERTNNNENSFPFFSN